MPLLELLLEVGPANGFIGLLRQDFVLNGLHPEVQIPFVAEWMPPPRLVVLLLPPLQCPNPVLVGAGLNMEFGVGVVGWWWFVLFPKIQLPFGNGIVLFWKWCLELW